ncbi:MAG: hmuO [Marmoricola sp.]|nr:hmuO [Marmoricola sp.]
MTAAPADGAVNVVTALYLGTKTLHTEAERSGIIRDLLRGQASRDGYISYLRNLVPAYEQLELGLARHQDTPALAELAAYNLDRAPAIKADLVALCGDDWADVPLLDEGAAYGDRIAETAAGDGSRLIAHAYARYLGDLSGGQILQRLLAKSPGLTPAQLTFYDFPLFPDLVTLKSGYRDALARAGTLAVDPQGIIDEGGIAFTHNIAVSWAVQKALPEVTVAAAE